MPSFTGVLDGGIKVHIRGDIRCQEDGVMLVRELMDEAPSPRGMPTCVSRDSVQSLVRRLLGKVLRLHGPAVARAAGAREAPATAPAASRIGGGGEVAGPPREQQAAWPAVEEPPREHRPAQPAPEQEPPQSSPPPPLPPAETGGRPGAPGDAAGDPRVTDLGHFRRGQPEFPALPPGQFRLVKRLAGGIHGDVFRYCWLREDDKEEPVAVKRLRSERLWWPNGTETDERAIHLQKMRAPEAEDALTEIGILAYLARQPDLPPFLLRLRGVFAEERRFTWLVTELADGGELFEVAAAGCIAESGLQRYMWQLLQAVAYLHKHNIGHRDISLENILLKGGRVKLMDFGMSASSHSASGVPLRFFRAVGKDSYRAPETYVPVAETATAQVPTSLSPSRVAMAQVGTSYLCELRFPADAVPGQHCLADVWGYEAHPADVFSAGACLFMLAWQSAPWKRASLADPLFAFVHAQEAGTGLGALLRHWEKPPLQPEAMELLEGMLRVDPVRRPSAAGCLTSPWLAAAAAAGAGEEGGPAGAAPGGEAEASAGAAAAVAAGGG